MTGRFLLQLLGFTVFNPTYGLIFAIGASLSVYLEKTFFPPEAVIHPSRHKNSARLLTFQYGADETMNQIHRIV